MQQLSQEYVHGLQQAIAKYPSKTAFATAHNITVGSLDNWLSGAPVRPRSLTAINRILKRANLPVPTNGGTRTARSRNGGNVTRGVTRTMTGNVPLPQHVATLLESITNPKLQRYIAQGYCTGNWQSVTG